MSQQRILVTGANGFVGKAVCAEAVSRGYMARGTTRSASSLASGVENCVVGTIDGETNWQHALIDCQVVVHLAARVHVMAEKAKDPLAEFRRVNVDGTLALARQAVAAGVQRFIFISSVKVNGEETVRGRAFTADDNSAPLDPYGISKLEAEQGLHKIAAETGMKFVIIRPPLVYGPGVRANFHAMMRWLDRGIPLPLGATNNNRRSLVALDNLVDLILTCVDHPAAANQTFLVADGEDLSTTQLLQRMAKALGKPARLIPIPPTLIVLGTKLVGKSAIAQRLCGSLQVDITKTRRLLGWNPPLFVEEGLKKAADGYSRETLL